MTQHASWLEEIEMDNSSGTSTGTGTGTGASIGLVTFAGVESKFAKGHVQWSFVNGLLEFSEKKRLTVLEASKHPFLISGDIETTEEVIPRARQGQGLLLMDPCTLHQGQPVTWPPFPESDVDREGEEKEDEGEEGWARRQYSVLWSPMPQSLDKDENRVVNMNRRMGMERSGAQPYRLHDVSETMTEAGTLFA